MTEFAKPSEKEINPGTDTAPPRLIIDEAALPELPEPLTLEQKEAIAQEQAAAIFNSLKQDLIDHNLSAKTSNIPHLDQQYSTDCGIACARMAIAKLSPDINTSTTDQFLEQAGLKDNIAKITGADGNEGPYDDIISIGNYLLNHKIKRDTRRLFYIQGDTSPDLLESTTQSFIKALENSLPVQLSIFFPDLHPDDHSELKRNHAVMISGYQMNGDNIELIAQDPKPQIGGQKIIDQILLAKALMNCFTIYSRLETESEIGS